MSRFRKPALRELEPYIPGIQPPDAEGWVKLNTNESPHPPAPGVREAVSAAAESLRLYPDPTQATFRAALATTYGVGPEQVIGGNGGDEVLAMAVRAFVPQGGRAAYLDPSYGLVAPLLRINDVEGECHEFTEDFRLPATFVESDAPLKFVTNPNSPTGTLIPLADVAALCAVAPGVVVVDEAYVDFAPTSALALLDAHPNMLIVRSMSKSFGLAGLRLGFAIASAELIADIIAVKDDYNLSRLQLAAGVAALTDRAYWRRTIDVVVTNRMRLAASLEERGWKVLPSAANFIFGIPPAPARDVYESLLARRVLVRHLDHPRVRDGLRITIGTWSQCEALLAALDARSHG